MHRSKGLATMLVVVADQRPKLREGNARGVDHAPRI